jgi:ethanolamine utilization protein EutM
MAIEALGLLETKGLVALMEGTDAILKAANVALSGWERAGAGLVTVFIVGDVASVKAAIDAGSEAASKVGTVVSAHVIARPHENLGPVLPQAASKAGPANPQAKPVSRK